MVAHYNDDARHVVASFNSLPDAQAYADQYGGEVEAIGVAFAVGEGADHAQARDDADNGDGSWAQGAAKRAKPSKASKDEIESTPAK